MILSSIASFLQNSSSPLFCWNVLLPARKPRSPWDGNPCKGCTRCVGLCVHPLVAVTSVCSAPPSPPHSCSDSPHPVWAPAVVSRFSALSSKLAFTRADEHLLKCLSGCIIHQLKTHQRGLTAYGTKSRLIRVTQEAQLNGPLVTFAFSFPHQLCFISHSPDKRSKCSP